MTYRAYYVRKNTKYSGDSCTNRKGSTWVDGNLLVNNHCARLWYTNGTVEAVCLWAGNLRVGDGTPQGVELHVGGRHPLHADLLDVECRGWGAIWG